QFASDEKFEHVVLEKTVPIKTTFEIKKEPIPDGTYFMRVAFMDALGLMGQYSASTEIIKDTVPPKITNATPDEGQQFYGEESYCDVTGLVKGATMLAI